MDPKEGRYFSNPQNTVTEAKRIIYTPSAFARETLFFVQEIGHLKSIKPHKSSRDALDSYLFIHVLGGGGTLTYAGSPVDMQAGMMALLDCRKPYSHSSSESDPWELNWIHFSGRDAAAFYAYFLAQSETPVLSGVPPFAFTQLHQELMQLCGASAPISELQASLLLNTLFTRLIASCTDTPAAQDEKMASLRVYLDEHYAEKLSLDTLAATFFISKFYLCRRFKEDYHTTIQQYIQNRRISKSMELLRYSDLTIHEIARQVGFENGNYFNKVFLQSERMTAGQYRRTWRGKQPVP